LKSILEHARDDEVASDEVAESGDTCGTREEVSSELRTREFVGGEKDKDSESPGKPCATNVASANINVDTLTVDL
jgi:hypothetical protein